MGLVIGISEPLSLAAVSTAVSLILGVPLAWLLVNRQFAGRPEVAILAAGALVLPAPILCSYFLLGQPPLWSWGMAGAAVLSAAPLVVRAGRTSFAALDPLYGKAARSLGASEWRVLWRVEFPLVWRRAFAAAALAFARVLAECFAIVLIAPRISR